MRFMMGFTVRGAVEALFSRLFSTTASLGADATFARASAGTLIDHEE